MSRHSRIADEIDAEAEAALREVEEEELREAEAKEREYEEAKKRRDQEQAANGKEQDDVLEQYRKADAKALAALEEAASKKRERDEAEGVEVNDEEGDNKKIAIDTEPVTVV